MTDKCKLVQSHGGIPRVSEPSGHHTGQLATGRHISESSCFEGAPFPIAAALFDIDGTVVGRNHAIAPRTKRAIQMLKQRGVVVGFATGRASFATREVGAELGIDGPSMFFAGSLIQDVASGTVLYRVDLSEHSVRSLLALSNQQQYHLEFYTEGDFFAERMSPELVIHQQYSSRPAVIASLPQLAAQTPFIKAVMMATAGKAEEKLRRELGQITGIHVTYSYGAVHPDIVFANIVDAQATRGAAFQELLKINNCASSQVATFGDAEADSAFLGAAGFGIATGNAVEAAKRAATFITATVDEGGVGLAIEKLFL